ncbi:hypothetical protein [Salinigranum halophilum]|uniref:hypothetical protein n=1 Tax=Salinigranum halophilum TaxID=2565931 RepID=UPI0010A8A3E9|nr:hypothetical protein [Salinigranum halophilum]
MTFRDSNMSVESALIDNWFFDTQPAGKSHSPGLLQKKTLDRSLDTFVKEILQNINDAGVEGEEPVKATFRLVEFEERLPQEFKEALRWDNLLEHVRAAAKEQSGPGLQDYLGYLDDGGTFRILIAEEENTTGIQGGEISSGTDYAALVRDPGSSNKSGGAGGRHGLGSSVLWVASGLQTVLFNSHLADHEDGQKSPRLVGRSFLPTHQAEDGLWHENEGWFGDHAGLDDEDLRRPTSLWDGRAAQLAERLGFSRSDVEGTGTSTMIVGFRDPSDPSMSEQPDASDVADVFEETAAEYFWPAISQGNLEVHLDMAGDQRHVTEETVRDIDSVVPYIECYEKRYDAPQSLGGPGTIASLEFPYEIRSKQSEDTPSKGKVSLAVRRAEPANDERIGDIAMFRGSGMVVKYKAARHLGYSGNFHATLACGNARPSPDESPSPEDAAIDDFLGMAEPPAHDDWVGTKNDELQGTYESGCVKCVKRLKKDLLQEYLAEILYGDDSRDGDSLRPDRQILPKTKSSRGRKRGDPTPSIKSPFDWMMKSVRIEDNRWVFNGAIRPDVDGANVTRWSVSVSLTAMYEDNREADDIPIANIDVEESGAKGSVNGDGGSIETEDGVDEINFVLTSDRFSDTDPRLGDIGETKFKIVDGSVFVEEGDQQ